MTAYRSRGTKIGDYRLDGELARTRSVVTYRATHAALGRSVVIKVMAEASTFRNAHHQFLHEARVLDRLRHPGVARVYDCGVLDDGRAWFATDVLAGHTLAEMIAAGARIDVARVLFELSAILEHAHRAGIAHRNLRAETIVCVPDGGGLRLVIDGWANARELSVAPTDAPADVQALGLVAFQLLSGVMAFSTGGLAMLTQVSVAGRFPRAPRAVTQLVDDMLARVLRVRPTMADVRASAQRILASHAQQRASVAQFLDIEVDAEATQFGTMAVAV